MGVVAINGSPRENGNTAYAIGLIADELAKQGIETEIITIGGKLFAGCRACGGCEAGKGCVIGDELNPIVDKLAAADGIVIASPVYYAGINGVLKTFLDRAFYSSGHRFRLKPAAALVVARRAGNTVALHNIQQYFELAEMLQAPTAYWAGLHGGAPSEAAKDHEGVQVTRQQGKNLAYLIKVIQSGAVPPPEQDRRVWTNFIR